MSDRLDVIKDRIQKEHDLRPNGFRGHQPASMVTIGSVLWMVDEIERLRSDASKMASELLPGSWRTGHMGGTVYINRLVLPPVAHADLMDAVERCMGDDDA